MLERMTAAAAAAAGARVVDPGIVLRVQRTKTARWREARSSGGRRRAVAAKTWVVWSRSWWGWAPTPCFAPLWASCEPPGASTQELPVPGTFSLLPAGRSYWFIVTQSTTPKRGIQQPQCNKQQWSVALIEQFFLFCLVLVASTTCLVWSLPLGNKSRCRGFYLCAYVLS